MAKDNYMYYNRNPRDIHTQDCVCRAISTATGLKYEAVNNLLDLTADENECEKLCVCCYEYLLTGTLCYHCKHCNFKRTVSDVAQSYPRNKLIIRVKGHLTCSIFGTILDIWDCNDELVDCYWIVD